MILELLLALIYPDTLGLEHIHYCEMSKKLNKDQIIKIQDVIDQRPCLITEQGLC